jgi:hypothetical protein
MLFVGLAVIIAGLCTVQAQQVKKYQIKSGIITFDIVATFGKMEMKSKAVVYFDDYGMKERRDTYDGNNIKESFFSDGKNLYLVIYAEKAVYKRGVAFRGTEYKFDWEEIKPSGKAKKIANMTVVGKNCEAFEMTTGGTVSTFAGWNNICLYLGTSQKGMSTSSKAVKLEENVSIPADKFKAPAGFALK